MNHIGVQLNVGVVTITVDWVTIALRWWICCAAYASIVIHQKILSWTVGGCGSIWPLTPISVAWVVDEIKVVESEVEVIPIIHQQVYEWRILNFWAIVITNGGRTMSVQELEYARQVERLPLILELFPKANGCCDSECSPVSWAIVLASGSFNV